MQTWSYQEALAWLYGRQRLGMQLGLERMERLLSALGDPHHTFRAVHVAGTNGKGSVTRMVAEMMRRSGHRVGATTSPHLVRFTERIETDRPITEGEVAAGLLAIRPHVEELDGAGSHCTFFEVVTALAFWHFREQDVDWAVVETGLGGRLDATNVLRPAVTVITNVGADHLDVLGPTLGDVAWEKSGIMKPGVPCVTAARGPPLTLLKARSHELGVPMSIIGEDYVVLPEPGGLALLRPTGESHYHVGLAGAHQLENAAVAIATADALRSRGVRIAERAVREAVAVTTNPGRLELVQDVADAFAPGAGERSVAVLVDGAHNPPAAEAVARHLDEIGWRGVDLVCGFLRDKDWAQVLAAWAPAARRVWAVPVRNPRREEPDAIAAAARRLGREAATAPDVGTALRQAVEAGADRILVSGSLFLAGEALAVLGEASQEEIRGSQ